MGANRLTLGEWNSICDVCGFKYKSSQLRKRWDGLMVCNQDYETRHDQDLIRAKPEKAPPPWVRPEPEDQFLLVCNLFTRSAYAGLGTAGCMQAGESSFSYAFLLALYDDTLSPVIAVSAPAPAPASAPALKFNVASNSQYLPLPSVGGM